MMMNSIAKNVYLILILIFLHTLIIDPHAEAVRELRDKKFISDGLNNITDRLINRPYLLLKGTVDFADHKESCEHMFGFLPCADNVFGHIFLILVYQYLLFKGESILDEGGEDIFTYLGPGVYGASIFNIIGALPEALLILVSELMKRKESAEEYVYTGVGLLAGSSIFDLTLLWGVCIIVGRRVVSSHDLPANLHDWFNPKKLFAWLKGPSPATTTTTKLTARIMVLSVVPFLIIQLLQVVTASFARRSVLLVALVVSVGFLLTYFGYLFFDDEGRLIQNRRFEYVRHQHVMLGIIGSLKDNTRTELLTDNGTPNLDILTWLFQEMDVDGNDLISKNEIRDHLAGRLGTEVDADHEIEEMMKEFDLNHDGDISMVEFLHGTTEWIKTAKETIELKQEHPKAMDEIRKVFVPMSERARKKQELKKNMCLEIFQYAIHKKVASEVGFLTENDTFDVQSMKSLFDHFDEDGDGYITKEELEKHIKDVKFTDKVPLQVNEAVDKMMEMFDFKRNNVIDRAEFFKGVQKLMPGQAKLKQGEGEKDKTEHATAWKWTMAVMKLIFGLLILGVLAEPLIHSVQGFSNAINIPSFFAAFVLVPLATGLRSAFSVMTNVRSRKVKTRSTAFSEIYEGVFMNNLLGFVVVLTLIYARGLTWEYSAEVLVVIIVCVVMGSLTSFHSTFPVWLSIVAFLLYPASLVLIYLLHNFLNYT